MKQNIYHILSEATASASVSFKKFAGYLAYKTETETSFRKMFYGVALKYFEEHPELKESVPVNRLKDYPEIMHILHGSLFSPLSDEQEVLWALSAPGTQTIFYSTDAFYKLMWPGNPDGVYSTASEEEKKTYHNNVRQVQYRLILQRIYNIDPPVNTEMVYVWTNKNTHLPRYFSVEVDSRFTEVIKTGPAPQICKADLKMSLQSNKRPDNLENFLPLSAFSFRGFNIVTATDVTERYALHKMRSAIIRHTPGDFASTNDEVTFLLKVLCGSTSLQFGMLPFLTVNGKLVSFYNNYTHSIAISLSRSQQLAEEVFMQWLSSCYDKPAIVLYGNEDSEDNDDNPFFRAFAKSGIKAYGAIPVFHNQELAGMLEVSATDKKAMNKSLLAKLDAALPILAQMMHNTRAEFKDSLDHIIMSNFTSIQPAVQWKFNEVAWQNMRNQFDNTTDGLSSIRFENVYPLYGAVDIRNSTIKRNDALYRDMQAYFSLLSQTLACISGEEAEALQAEAKKLQEQSYLFMSAGEEGNLMRLMEKAEQLLRTHSSKENGIPSCIDNYFKAINPVTGTVYQNRRALETSIQTINRLVNDQVDILQAQIQQSYPVYFEKFRTDGVEYDIYIGQSLTPHIEFRNEYLNHLRIWQLRIMAAIAKLTSDNKTLMPIPLQTTQMIYVNANAIDISFRTDEKRFDVEGAYNIRYHIVKKRIDKVNIKTTGERLTQPDTISIVYSQPAHAEEYKKHIALLQQEGVLQPTTEELELEELQGIKGLLALRVGVTL